MLKIRKYIEGEVIETNFVEGDNKPSTEDIQSMINSALRASKPKMGNINSSHIDPINNVHLIKAIDYGVIYKFHRTELVRVGSQKISMELLFSNDKLEVILPPMYAFSSANNFALGVASGVVPHKTTNLINPFSNVYGNILSHRFVGLDKKSVDVELPVICLGDELTRKHDNVAEWNKYTLMNLAIEWLVSSPNLDLSLEYEVNIKAFARLLGDMINCGEITKEQVDLVNKKIGVLNAKMMEDISDSVSPNRISSYYTTINYNLLIIILSALSEYTPNIIQKFFDNCFQEADYEEYPIDFRELERLLNDLLN